MREPSPGFEREEERLERDAIKRARDEEINWTPENPTRKEPLPVRLMKWTDIDKSDT